RLRGRVVPLPQVQRDLTGQARRETDDALAMLRQDLLVDARPAVIALEEAYRGKLDEVLIARPVPGEEHEMGIVGAQRCVGRGFLAALAAPEREICLEAEDRPDLPRLGLFVKRPLAVQVGVIGDRERVHAERLDPVQQIGDPVGAVEERVLAVGMEMNERHGYSAESAVFCALMQWLMLVATCIAAALLNRIARSAGAPLQALATLALGSVMLVAYLAGTIAQRHRIPRIVGYLLAGFVAGPAWLRLVRGPELEALDPIANGALALIAFAVGNALTVDALRVAGVRRTALLRILTGAMATPLLAVMLVVLTVG